jgi:hypothetical protein
MIALAPIFNSPEVKLLKQSAYQEHVRELHAPHEPVVLSLPDEHREPYHQAHAAAHA